MIKSMNKEFYGDNVRWFIGLVIDATPPFGLEGRVRIRIFGVHSQSTKDILQSDLPWAQCVIPTTEGGVSGLGRSPKLEAGALVFGFFIDGEVSQVPIVVGSLPRIEFPTSIQQSLEFENVTERLTNQSVFYENSIASIDTVNRNIEDSNPNVPDVGVKAFRVAEAVKFFLASGYTLKQAVSITAGLDKTSRMATGKVSETTDAFGLGGWTRQRLRNLKTFSENWEKFSTQLTFVLYELNTTQSQANSKLLALDNLDESKPNCQTVFAKQYLKLKDQRQIDLIVDAAVRLYGDFMG